MATLKELAPNWMKVPLRTINGRCREATWRFRSLPDFIIVGAQKSGTSSLYSYLSQHPQIVPSYKKEVHFFSGGLDPSVDSYSRGVEWYRAHFPLTKDTNGEKKVFEASPSYFFHPLAAERIAQTLPNIKIIVLLRSPTERAISHYFHSRKVPNREPLSIKEALNAEEHRIQPAIDQKNYKDMDFIRYSYKLRGLYRKQLERYFHHFQRNQILVVQSESFFSEPNTILRSVFEFVGVDAAYQIKNLSTVNVTRNRSAVSPEIYSTLRDFFQPHNQSLYELIGEDYGW